MAIQKTKKEKVENQEESKPKIKEEVKAATNSIGEKIIDPAQFDKKV